MYSLQVATDEDFRRQIGRDVFFDLVDHDKVRSFRVQKLMPFNIFKVYKYKILLAIMGLYTVTSGYMLVFVSFVWGEQPEIDASKLYDLLS